MKKLLVLICLCVSGSLLWSQSWQDTLHIVQLSDSSHKFQLDTSGRDKALVIIDWKGNSHGKIAMNKTRFRLVGPKIYLSLSLHSNIYSERFYASNFPSVRSQIDTSRFYNEIDLGQIVGVLNSSGDIEYQFELRDEAILVDVDVPSVKRAYSELHLKGEFASRECGNSQGAYRLMLEIAWLTLIYDTFSLEDYEKLDLLLAPCLGAEKGEDYLSSLELIRLIK